MKHLVTSLIKQSAGRWPSTWIPIQIVVISGFLSVLVACSPVKFSTNIDCSAFGGEGTCQNINGVLVGKPRAFKLDGGKIDVVFVNDNSASMSFYQDKLGSKLSSFVSKLAQSQSDFRVGITTTDISSQVDPSFTQNNPRNINQNGALQDGRLISLSGGRSFLTQRDGDLLEQFKIGIQRQESKNCDRLLSLPMSGSLDWGSATYRENCPSSDERGTMAAYNLIKNNPNGFIRDDSSKLVFVFLANEDVRSGVYSSKSESVQNFKLKTEDRPDAVVDLYKQKYPRKSIVMNTISILPGRVKTQVVGGGDVRESARLASARIFDAFKDGGSGDQTFNPTNVFDPGDESCLNLTKPGLSDEEKAQISKFGFSRSYSYFYSLGTRMTGGVEVSLCEGEYGRHLESIAERAVQNEFFVCRGLQIKRAWIGNIDLTAEQMQTAGVRTVSATADSEGYVHFPKKTDSQDEIKPGEIVNLDFTCAR